MAKLERREVTSALEKRTIVQATILRFTIHVVSAADYWPFTVATRDARRQWFLRAYRGPYTEDDFLDAAQTVRQLLSSGPQSRSTLSEAVGRDRFSWVGMYLDMVRVPPSGTWERRRADLYGLAEEWIPPTDRFASISRDQGINLLVRRYLGAFGPAAAPDIATWAGLGLDRIIPVLEPMDLRRYESEDGHLLFDLKRKAMPDQGVPAPVRFLAVWDAILLVHARRKRVIAEDHRPLIFTTKTPQSMPTFMVDGAVAGTWRYEGGRIDLSPFDVIPNKWRRELEDEAEALAAFHNQ